MNRYQSRPFFYQHIAVAQRFATGGERVQNQRSDVVPFGHERNARQGKQPELCAGACGSLVLRWHDWIHDVVSGMPVIRIPAPGTL